MAELPRFCARLFGDRYRGIPAAVLLPQLFLAFGWLRAAVAHGTSGTWWSGEEILTFVDRDTSAAIEIYEPFLANVVRQLPALTAVVVLALELLVALMLGLNIKPLAAIAVGTFLNLQFMLAGVVNPSAFYLVIALVVVLWRMEGTVSLSTSRRLAKGVAIAAGITTLFMLPFVTTPTPARAIDDPAVVLIFLSLLFATATWWTSHRIAFD